MEVASIWKIRAIIDYDIAKIYFNKKNSVNSLLLLFLIEFVNSHYKMVLVLCKNWHSLFSMNVEVFWPPEPIKEYSILSVVVINAAVSWHNNFRKNFVHILQMRPKSFQYLPVFSVKLYCTLWMF